METRTYNADDLRELINRTPNRPGAIRTMGHLYDALHNARQYPVVVRLNQYEVTEIDSW